MEREVNTHTRDSAVWTEGGGGGGLKVCGGFQIREWSAAATDPIVCRRRLHCAGDKGAGEDHNLRHCHSSPNHNYLSLATSTPPILLKASPR